MHTLQQWKRGGEHTGECRGLPLLHTCITSIEFSHIVPRCFYFLKQILRNFKQEIVLLERVRKVEGPGMTSLQGECLRLDSLHV